MIKCIYCNSETELTSSDILTYAITGAKLTKSFVCKTHNALTNDKYEKKFVSDLDFFRNCLGLTTRDGKPIQYKADISVDGTKMHNVKLSNKESLYAPKGVIAGIDDNGNQIIMAPMDKIKKIGKGKESTVDISNIIVHKTIEADSFIGYYAVHSVAKMAYEWYCYINDIEEYKKENAEIVEYILGNIDGDFVDIIVDGNYYAAMDKLSEIGTNSFFQYDDINGYRYVVFDLWKTISYRVKICKSPNRSCRDTQALVFKLYLYHIDGSKTQTAFGAFSLDNNKKPEFSIIKPENVTVYIWQVFTKRIEKIMTTMILSIHVLKKEVDRLSLKLNKYDAGKIDLAQLLGFEENNVITTIEIISQLYFNKDKYDVTKSFNENLATILDLDSDTITKTQEDKIIFLKSLVAMDKENELSKYIWNGIWAFNEMYENEKNIIK